MVINAELSNLMQMQCISYISCSAIYYFYVSILKTIHNRFNVRLVPAMIYGKHLSLSGRFSFMLVLTEDANC